MMMMMTTKLDSVVRGKGKEKGGGKGRWKKLKDSCQTTLVLRTTFPLIPLVLYEEAMIPAHSSAYIGREPSRFTPLIAMV